MINKEELLRANYISQANLSDQEIDQILNYVENNYGGKFNFTNALKMLYRNPNSWFCTLAFILLDMTVAKFMTVYDKYAMNEKLRKEINDWSILSAEILNYRMMKSSSRGRIRPKS